MSRTIPERYLDFGPEPFRWRMGVHHLDLDDWIEIDDDYEADLAEKAALLATRHRDVFRSLPGSEEASAEVLAEVQGHLGRRFPLLAPRTAPEPVLHPLDAAGRLVQEDLCLMQRRDKGWVLTAASVCFPTMWDLPSKIGQALDAIHDPVPRYGAQLGATVDRFFDRLTADHPVWRVNWSVVDDPALRLEAAERYDNAEPAGPEGVALRVERQTLRKLPRSGATLFTIRIHRQAVTTLAPTVGRELAAAVGRLPTDVAGYKASTADCRAVLDAVWPPITD